MSTAFPTGLDTTLTLPNPVGTDLLANTNANLDHDYQHSLVNDAIRALETKLGIDSSAVTSSIDYLLKNASSNNPGHTHSASSLSGVLPLGGGTMTGAIAFAGAQTFDASKLLIASQATGDLLYASSTSAWSRLAKASDGNVLTLVSGLPAWASAGGGGGMSIGGAVTSGTGGSILYVDGSGNLAQDNSHHFWDATNHRLGIGTASPSFFLDLSAASLGATASSTDGLRLINPTAAAAAAQQFSPFLHLEGQGWKTATTAATQAVAFRLDVEPVQGSANPLGGLVIRSNINGAGFTNSFTFGSDGALYFKGAVGSTVPRIQNDSDSIAVYAGSSGNVILHSDNQTQWMDRSGTLQATFDNSTKRLRIGSGSIISAALTVTSSGGTSTGLRFSDSSDNLFANLYSFASGYSSLITDSGIRMKTGAIIGVETNMPTSFNAGILFSVGTAPSADPSTTGNAALWCDTNGFQYRTSVTNEGAGILAHIHNRAADQVGAGTNATLGTSLTVITFGTTNPSISLPTAGTYLVEADIEIVSGANLNDVIQYELWNSTDSTTIGISRTDSNLGISQTESLDLRELVTITASKTLTIRMANTSGVRGTITSTKTKVRYIRLF